MKTNLLFTLILFLTASLVFSQSLVLSHDGEDLENGEEIMVQGQPDDPEILIELAVANEGSSAMYVLCQRYLMDIVPGSMNTFCWGYICYGPSTNLSAVGHSLEPGEITEDDFSGHYNPLLNEGVSTVAYTFFDEANPNDSVQVVVKYSAGTVGVNEFNHAERLAIHPNPADNLISINLVNNELGDEITLKLINTNGALVKEIRTTGPSVRMNTSDLAEGIYMVQAFSDAGLIGSEKIIIRH